ncbi:NUDIX hydrolase domain-like protein [Syncephalis fuscata]|nr:NUDIX hydrolase domain-like protein [Syncephalis fuscata]
MFLAIKPFTHCRKLLSSYRVSKQQLHQQQQLVSLFYRTFTTNRPLLKNKVPITLPDTLDAATLNKYSQRLERARPPAYRYRYSEKQPTRDASVLVPLCMVDGQPSVLFTLRSSRLKAHRGEISFPGGKRDPTDENLTATALRETQEEIGLASEIIQILGMHHTLPDKSLTIRVHPFVGYIERPFTASAPVSALKFAHDEVEAVFAVSFRELINPLRWRLIQFRGKGPLVPEWQIHGLPGVPENAPAIWGLTAFILHNVLRTLLNVDAL